MFIILLCILAAIFSKQVILWEASADIPILGNTTVQIYFDDAPTVPEIGVRLIVRNLTVIDEEISTEIVVDDDTLLELIELIPALRPYKKIIDALILAHHKIPGDVFSIRLEIRDLKYNKTEIEGDVFLDGVLMKWKDKCLWEGTHDFGEFDIHIPQMMFRKKWKRRQ